MKGIGLCKLFPFLVILLFLWTPSYGQTKDSYLIYSSLKGNAGNYIGGGITLDLVRNNKYSFGIGYHGQLRLAANLPSDYNAGIMSLFIMGMNIPRDNLESVSFTFGQIFPGASKKSVRYHLKGGLTYSVVETPTNWVKDEYAVLFLGNYSYDYQKFHEIGILFNPTVDIPIFKFLGISVGPYSFLNQKTISYGIELSTLIGKVKK